MPPSSIRTAATLLLVAFALSCGGASSPVDPTSGVPDPSAPGQTPTVTPVVTVSASSLSLGAAQGEATVVLHNLGPGSATWSHQTSASWITATPAGGTLPAGGSVLVRVAVDRTGLGPGTYASLLRFVVGAASLEVGVQLDVPPPFTPAAEVFPASLALGQDDASATVDVVNAGTAPLHWSWSGPGWAPVEPAGGTTAPGATTRVTVTPDRSALSDGSHTATLTLDSDGGTRVVALSVVVASPAKLSVSPSQVDFGSSGTTANVTIANGGGRPLSWTAADDAGWLSLGAGSGSVAPGASAALALAAQRGGLTPGGYSASLSISSNGGSAAVAVSLTVPAPDPPPPPPSPPPPSGSAALAGRVIDQFGGHGIAGLTVQFAGATVTTDATGTFTVPGTTSSTLRDLGLSGPGVHSRATFARSSDTEWRIVPSGFDMAAFDDMAREYEPRTIRWVGSPSVYVDVRPDGFAGGPELDQWVSEVQSQAAAFISEWTGGTVSAGSVQVGSSPPPDGLSGTIVIHFSEDASVYGASSTVGLARTFWTGDRSISSAVIWLRFVRFSGASHAGIRRAILGHEFGHTLGMGHMHGSTPSLMTPSVSASSLTSFDQDAGFLLYTRSPGNTSPDVDSAAFFRGSLGLTRAPGFYEWVCGSTE